MLEEVGTVIEITTAATAKVKVKRSNSCENCVSKNMCHSLGPSDEMVVEAENPVNAQLGQSVMLSLPSKIFLKASVIVYLTPVIALFTGAITGQYFSEGLAVTGAICGLTISFLSIYIYNKNLKPNAYTPTINNILRQ